MSMMIMNVELCDGGAVELEGTQARYWVGTGEADYVGPIEGLPWEVLRELTERGFFKTPAKVKVLAKFALENYEEGGHWAYECWGDEEYEDLLDEVAGDVEAAKIHLKRWWEFVNEQQAETRWE